MNPYCGDERPRVLSADSVKSLVTINPAVKNPKSTTAVPSNYDLAERRRQNNLRHASIFQHSTSVAACSMSSNIDGDDNTTTLIAACNAGATGWIHLATIVEGTDKEDGEFAARSVTMKYSSKSDDSSNRSFAAVCIANYYQDGLLNQSGAAILAIDGKGKLYAHRIQNIFSTESDSNKQLFDMELCDNNVDDNRKHKSPKSKKGRNSKATQNSSSCQPCASMNTLTPRTESDTTNTKTVSILDESLQKSPCSTPKRKGRKRKATSPSGKDEGVVYAIASSLNEPHVLPSQSPPVIVRISFEESDEHSHKAKMKKLSRTKITGLEHVDSPMTCIIFASRASCGVQLWKTLTSRIKSRKVEENVKSNIGNDEGIVVMGLQDGSLYASLVVNGEAVHTSKILQLKSGEPLLSLYILRTELPDSKLVAVGMLGTLAIIDSDESGATIVYNKRLPFHGRFCSLAFVESHKSMSNETGISMIGTNDTGKTYLFQLSMKCGGSVEKNADHHLQLEKVFRVPITGGSVSFISTQQSKFIWSSQSGKVSLTRITPDLKGKRETKSQSILATLRQKESSRCNMTLHHTVNDTTTASKYEAVTKTLTAAIHLKSKQTCAHSFHTSQSQQSNLAAKEIRDAIRIVSLSSSSSPPPIECAINASKLQTFDLAVKSEKSGASSSWNHSIHTMLSTKMRTESIKHMTPLCYRRTRDGLKKVYYGGSSTSFNFQNNSSIHISMHDVAPVCIYATLSKTYVQNEDTDNNPWEESMALNEHFMVTISGRAKRCYMQGAVVPFKLGKKSSIPLAGDVFAPLLKFAKIVRLDGDAGNVRNAAEKEVQRLMQAGCVGKSLPMTMMDTRSHSKVHCSSNSAFLASSKKIDECHKQVSLDNRERDFAPIALVYNSQKDKDLCELGFAFGSISNNSNEIMSLIPLMRHSIIRCAQQEEDLQVKVLKDECYSRLLSEKRAIKIARHVDKAASELLSRIEKPHDDACSAALLTKCISLYEIMRTLQFIIG